MSKLRAVLLLTCLIASATESGRAQEPGTAPPAAESAAAGGWNCIVQPYFMIPTMSGESGVRGLVADVNASSGEILGALDFGAMLYLEMRNETWAFSLDALFMDLGATGTTPLGSVKADMSQAGIQASGYRRLAPWAEGSLGLQYNSLKASFAGTGPFVLSSGDEKSWWDPYLGVRLTMPRQDRWLLAFTGSVGGFGIGSDFAWQVYPQVGYRFNRTFELNGGYRVIYMDYRDGEGIDEFLYKMTTQGLQLGAAFHF